MLVLLEGKPDTGKTGLFADVSTDSKIKILYISLETKGVNRTIKKKHKVIYRDSSEQLIATIESIDAEKKDYDIIVVDPISRMNTIVQSELQSQGIKYTPDIHSTIMTEIGLVANKCSKPVIFINHVYEDDKGKPVSFAQGNHLKVGGYFADTDMVFRTKKVEMLSETEDDDRFLGLRRTDGRLPFDMEFKAHAYKISGANKESENKENGVSAGSILQEIIDYAKGE